ncbi:MAG: hypothetical protein ACLP1X_33570 [Polyangiaceae bacterium]|jgi:tetratricopeptide (TPR) repeat protein
MKGALVFALLVTACASTPPVERVYGGRTVLGRYIEPEAYAAFLRGAIAEAGGDLRSAIAAYDVAAELDPRGAEIWARIGAVRCAADPLDRRADDAFRRALATDDVAGRTWEAKAQCALVRGDGAGSRAAAMRAAELDASADGAIVLLARAAGAGRDAATRERLVSLTLTSRDRVAAWDALARWAESHGDVVLWARALEMIAPLDASRREAVARAAEELAGVGEMVEARSVAAAAVDASDEPLSASRRALASRLAVDEAIGRGDVETVRIRASHARVPLDEAAARALLAGKVAIARELVSMMAVADPSALGARLVLAVAEGRDVLGAALRPHGDAAPVSSAVLVAFGAALVRVASLDQTRESLTHIGHDRIAASDDRVVRAAVALVARGALPATALPPDGVVELAAMGLADTHVLGDRRSLDARHAYLALAIEEPAGARARELGAPLARVGAWDPVVASAAALVTLASGSPVDRGAAGALLAIDPADPLLAATALCLAEKSGDSEGARRAHAALMAREGVY